MIPHSLFDYPGALSLPRLPPVIFWSELSTVWPSPSLLPPCGGNIHLNSLIVCLLKSPTISMVSEAGVPGPSAQNECAIPGFPQFLRVMFTNPPRLSFPIMPFCRLGPASPGPQAPAHLWEVPPVASPACRACCPPVFAFACPSRLSSALQDLPESLPLAYVWKEGPCVQEQPLPSPLHRGF